MKIAIPDFCLVAVVAASASESLDFARRHFASDEVLDREQGDWPVLAASRLARRQAVVLDASDTSQQQQIDFLRLAKRFYAQPIALVLCNSDDRPDARTARSLETTGFRTTYTITSTELERLQIERVPLPPDLRQEHGPFDIIGDVHGCADELIQLLNLLGYAVRTMGDGPERFVQIAPPPGRRAIFVGDYVDRGPRSPDVLRIVIELVRQGHALAVPGNHDVKFLKWLRGSNVRLTHGLDLTVGQFSDESTAFRDTVREFLLDLPSHLWLEGGQLVVAHAGILEDMIGRESERVREFCLYGDTEGETDATGLVVRYHWAANYRGETPIVYGHTPVPDPEWINNTLCIDTGCCFGGKLTALRWPEREVVSVPAARMYARPGRPFGHPPVRPAKCSHPRRNRSSRCH